MGAVLRYADGGAYGSTMDRIMLRFRPIAPKPVAGGTVSGGSSADNSEVRVRSVRGKRRYVRDGNSSSKRCCSRKRKASSTEETNQAYKTSSSGSVSGGERVVTLPLLPETPDRKESPVRVSPSRPSVLISFTKQSHNQPVWLNFSNKKVNDNHPSPEEGRVSVEADRTSAGLTGSIVMVECVTDAWVDGYSLECWDEEKMRNLETDTCPGFISDESHRVGWTNRAYREMVGHEEAAAVWLVVKGRVPMTCPAFTCRVRLLRYNSGEERSSLTLPCDVMKVDSGGFAWRLDLKAALSLSLGR